ncbi:isoflavone 2'-hydroxylase [Arachis hypogaea]|uniref:Cytochrome P450 n=1 Tax=Arachis hypogaea TaxID=3818 RepID=A0A444WTL2_ARAHY|nr:isoflavone 2'-hydroxylase [Arachis hypogaea]QHO40685.1 Cytochrome P450 [Arachis hypogaea]RYQ80754.1 hypothetical protein Ahy_Scaffold1g106952 isoform L [Arachis hypogaea]
MMELSYYNSLLLFVVFITSYMLFTKRFKNLPPSPPSLPLIGNLHLLKPPVFRTFYALSQKYGPIFSFRFGSQLSVVVSSASLAEECFTKNDIVLANRFRSAKTKHLTYNNTVVITSPYGDHWRNLRRICSLEILSTQRLNSFTGIRRDETARLVRSLSEGLCEGFTRVEVRSKLTELTFNTIMRMVSGKRYYGEECDGTSAEEAKKFRDVMDDMAKFGLSSNLGDFVPVVRLFDFSGDNRKLQIIGEKMDALFQGLIDEHRSKKESSNTMIDHLLSFQESQPEYYTDQIIKGLIMAMMVAGTETSAITIEWALSNLLNHPQVLEKARMELDTHVGQDRLLEEDDLTKLTYLHNIISETLRLYPAAPMLLPHLSAQDCTLGGYHVPRNTLVFVNAWAIHRDPDLWAQSSTFMPQRFENADANNNPYGFMPFGMGRRACPGSGLAQRTLGLTLGSLIQCFDWKRIGEEEVDMTEGHGTLMSKAIPLEAQCKARPIITKIFSQ